MLRRFFNKIDDIPFRSFISYAFLFALVSAIPLSAYLVQKETRYQVGASVDKYPKLEVNENLIPYPTNPPIIETVEKPFAKIGDSILIKGINFGEVKKESIVKIGQVVLQGEEIPFWSNTSIEAVVPQRSQNGIVEVIINGKTARWQEVLTIIR